VTQGLGADEGERSGFHRRREPACSSPMVTPSMSVACSRS
jgi:hypothetical protein